MKIVDRLLPNISVVELQKKLRIAEKDTAKELLDVTAPLIYARAAYKIAYIDKKSDDSVLIENKRFKSHVLRKNLENIGRVFPFIITIGEALESRSDNSKDILEKYYLDEIGNIALRKARSLFEDHLRKTFALEKVASMSPGSLKDWPIEEQRPLFELLDDAKEALGIRLTASLLMLPRKSLSGIYFPSEATFFSCQLCPRERCDSRKAKFDKKLALEYGIIE